MIFCQPAWWLSQFFEVWRDRLCSMTYIAVAGKGVESGWMKLSSRWCLVSVVSSEAGVFSVCDFRSVVICHWDLSCADLLNLYPKSSPRSQSMFWNDKFICQGFSLSLLFLELAQGPFKNRRFFIKHLLNQFRAEQ